MYTPILQTHHAFATALNRRAIPPLRMLVVLVLSLCGTFVSAQTFTNPIAPPLSADPSIVVDNGTYYFASTNDTGSITVQSSNSLATLGSAPRVNVFNPCCGWEHPSLWKLRGNWFMLWDDGNGNGVVTQSSGDPYGPWQVINGKVCTNFCRDLAFLYMNDQLWLLYSEGSVGYEIRIQPMSDPATPNGGSTAIIARDPQDPNDWEWAGGAPYGCGCIESPFPVQHNGTSSIVYSGNYYGGPNYGLGLAVFNGGDVTDPNAWTNRGKVFGSNPDAGVYGPGTTSIFGRRTAATTTNPGLRTTRGQTVAVSAATVISEPRECSRLCRRATGPRDRTRLWPPGYSFHCHPVILDSRFFRFQLRADSVPALSR